MGKLEKIYEKSPICIQNLMVSVKGFFNYFERYGKSYKEYYKELQSLDKLKLDEKIEYQNKELVKFVNYAYNNSKFYNELYKNININEIKTVEDLKKLPIVTKEMIRNNINDVITIGRKNAVEGHTGGTTGKSLVVLYTKEDMMKRMAILDFFKEKVGFINNKMRRATFNGKHIVPQIQNKKIFWRYNLFNKQMIYSSFHLIEENYKYYVKSLNKFKPQAIDGFFTSMCDVAKYIERNDLKLDFQPIAIFPTSETLNDEGVELLERVFKCKVYNQYSSSEGAPFITECKCGKLHINMIDGIFEFKENSNEILVTTFITHGTPLIRYEIGDSVTLSNNQSCECGNESIIVDRIEGRSRDFLYATNGCKINSGNVSNIFKNVPNAIVKVQIIQEEMKKIVIKLVVDKKQYKKEFEDLIISEAKAKLGNDMEIEINIVDDIKREKSGKYRMIVNLLNECNKVV